MPNLIETLDNNIMVLPKVQKKDDTYFPTYIYNLLRDYVSFLKSRNIEDYIVNTIVSFNKKMELALKNYYLGYQALAYNNFSDAMKIKGYDIVNSVINLDDVCYYRARVNDISNSSEEFSRIFSIWFGDQMSNLTPKHLYYKPLRSQSKPYVIIISMLLY